MAKTSKVNKNEQRKALVTKYATRRRELKAIIKDPATSVDDRVAAQVKLGQPPKDSNPIRLVQRCKVTRRRRGKRHVCICIRRPLFGDVEVK